MLIIAWLGSARLATSCTTEPVRARVYCPPNAQFLSQHVTFKSASHTRELHKRASSSVSTQPKSTHPPFTITTAAAASQPSAAFGCVWSANRCGSGNAAKLPHPRRVAASRLGTPSTAALVCSRPSYREQSLVHSANRGKKREKKTAQRRVLFRFGISAFFVVLCLRPA